MVWYLSPGASLSDLVSRPLELMVARGVLRPPTETPMPRFETFRLRPGATLNDLRNVKAMCLLNNVPRILLGLPCVEKLPRCLRVVLGCESKDKIRRIFLTSSKCIVRRNVPLKWLDYIDYTNKSVMAFWDFTNSLPEIRRLDVIAMIESLKERASLGQIPADSWQIQNITLYPELHELKWRFRGYPTFHVRQYHTEPIQLSENLLALHIHLKDVSGSELEIKTAQNQEISFAKMRYVAGRINNWVV